MSVFIPGQARYTGVPSKYPTHVQPRLNEIYQWIVNGYTDYSICETLSVGYSSYMEYKNRYPELQDLYARARFEKNNLVMGKMFQKATGHTAEVKKQVITKTGDVVELKSEIYTPPDVNAADLFLRNNMPGYIQPRQDGSGSAVHVHLSIDDARKAVGQLLQGREALADIEVDGSVIEIDTDDPVL